MLGYIALGIAALFVYAQYQKSNGGANTASTKVATPTGTPIKVETPSTPTGISPFGAHSAPLNVATIIAKSKGIVSPTSIADIAPFGAITQSVLPQGSRFQSL